MVSSFMFFFSSRRRHTRCALVTGVQTCALPIYDALAGQPEIAFDLGTGSDVRVMAVGQKKYPCCYLLQRIIDQVKALVSAHGIAPDAVADITVEVNRAFPTIDRKSTRLNSSH